MEGLTKITRVPVPTLVSFMEAVGAHPHQSRQAVSEFAGYSSRTGRRALPTLEVLGVIERDQNGGYTAVDDGLGRGVSDDEARLILRRALQSYRPFELLCEGLAHGEARGEAIRKASVLLDVPATGRDSFEVLVSWAVELGVLTEHGEALELADELSVESAEELGVISSEDVASETRARLYNAGRIGRAANNFLDETDRGLLAEALVHFREEQDKSVRKSGEVLENFLREIASDQGLEVEARRCNGASQLAQMLSGKDVIHTNHLHRVQGLSAVRHTKAHSKDKKTMAPWTVDSDGAFWAISGTLLLIRSVFEFIRRGRQLV